MIWPYRTHKDRPDPTSKDLEIWEKVEAQLIDHLYQGITGLFQRWGHRMIGRYSAKKKGKTVLELGVGHGHHLLYDANISKQNNYIGLDITRSLLSEARNRISTLIPCQGNACNLPFHNGVFDCVISIYTLEHFHNLEMALLECKRVLKANGRFLVAIPNEGGFLYNVGREYSSRCFMEKQFGINYDSIVKVEHCNEFWKIKNLLDKHFIQKRFSYLPMFAPYFHINIISCFELAPRA